MTKTIGILGGIKGIIQDRIVRLLVEQTDAQKHLNEMECLSVRYKDTLEYAQISLGIAFWGLKIEILKSLIGHK